MHGNIELKEIACKCRIYFNIVIQSQCLMAGSQCQSMSKGGRTMYFELHSNLRSRSIDSFWEMIRKELKPPGKPISDKARKARIYLRGLWTVNRGQIREKVEVDMKK